MKVGYNGEKIKTVVLFSKVWSLTNDYFLSKFLHSDRADLPYFSEQIISNGLNHLPYERKRDYVRDIKCVKCHSTLFLKPTAIHFLGCAMPLNLSRHD